MHTYIEQTIATLRKEAGLAGWMHLDAAGTVRVGAGMALEDEQAAGLLPFQVGMRAATIQEIAVDYARVKGMAAARSSAYYRQASAPMLEHEVLGALLRTQLVGLQVELREAVPGFDRLADKSKSRLLRDRYRQGFEATRRGLAPTATVPGLRKVGSVREIGFGLIGLLASLLKR